MKWKDSDEVMDANDEAGSAYEEDYSPLRSKNFNLVAKLAAAIAQPGVWIIFVALILLLVIFLMFFPKGETSSQKSNLSQQWQEIENKIASLEEQNKTMDEQIRAIQESADPLLIRLDRLESKFGKQLDDLQKQLMQLKSIPAQQKTTTAPKKVSAKKSTQKTAPKTYVVQKGDTLYSISKQFALSVSQLRKLNKLSSNEAIFPGQELKIKP